MSLLRLDIWEKVEQCDRRLQPWQGLPLVSVEGTPLKLHGCASVTVEIASCVFESMMVIADGLTAEAILGLDFLEKHNCILDMGKRVLALPGCSPIALMAPSRIDVQRPLPVSLIETVRIPAASELEVMANVDYDVNMLNQPLLLEQNPSARLPVRVARALVVPQSARVPIRILNPGVEAITLNKNTPVAILEFVDDLSISPVNQVTSHEEALPTPKENISSEKYSMLNNLVRKNSGHLNKYQREQLLALLLLYADIFAVNSDDVGRTQLAQHQIYTGDCSPIRQPPRRMPAARKEETRKLLQDMLRNDTIQPSSSPWASPIVLVQKKDGSFRFCVDYRKLNAVTRKDAYPLPRIDDTLDTLSGAHWFTTLDLISGYWQVEVEPADREKTAFCTPEGLFEFKVMPFGLCNAPATFQRLMNSALSGLHGNSCLVYLDDVIIMGNTFLDHLNNLQHVFHRIRAAGLKLQPNKCALCQKEVSFLGYIISQAGISTDLRKTERVISWPLPTSKREVQQFLGLANYYRRFIKNFAKIANPLHKLTEKSAPFLWTAECQLAFDNLKHSLTSAPVLAHPDYSKPFILDTDASQTGIGAVLSQVQDDGCERVIAYASKTLSRQERHYCVTRHELLAVVTFVHNFRPYLLGRKFLLRTDHGSLIWLQNFKEPEGQLARWITRLQEYDFTIVHRRGRNHANADALSRHPCTQCGRCNHDNDVVQQQAVTESFTTAEIVATTSTFDPQFIVISRESQMDDEALGPILRAVQAGEKLSSDILQGLSPESRLLHQQWDLLRMQHGKLWRVFVAANGTIDNLQLVVPQSLRNKILYELHDGPLGGHLGEDKMYSKLRERFYWPGSSKDVKNWCSTCSVCASRKSVTPNNRAALNTIRAGYPMQVIAVDILGPLPDSALGNRYVLVAMDYFTRWAEAYAIPNQEAETIAEKLVSQLFLRFSPPEQLHSDQGRQFEAKIMKEICAVLGINKTRTSPYHPQSDGLVERFNRTLLNMLATSCHEHPSTWDTQLQKVCMAYNTSVHNTTGYTPFFLMFGRQARLPVDILYGSCPGNPVTPNQYATQLRCSLQEAYDRVRNAMSTTHEVQKEYYDKRIHGKQFISGDLVWLHTKAVPIGQSRKLFSPWGGPHQVLDRLSDCTYRIRKLDGDRREQVVHFNRLKRCTPNTRFPVDVPYHSTPSTFGQNMEIDIVPDEMTEQTMDVDRGTTPPDNSIQPRRNPPRNRRPPDRFGVGISH